MRLFGGRSGEADRAVFFSISASRRRGWGRSRKKDGKKTAQGCRTRREWRRPLALACVCRNGRRVRPRCSSNIVTYPNAYTEISHHHARGAWQINRFAIGNRFEPRCIIAPDFSCVKHTLTIKTEEVTVLVALECF